MLRSWASWAQPSASTETPGPRVLTRRGNITGVSWLEGGQWGTSGDTDLYRSEASGSSPVKRRTWGSIRLLARP